MSNADLVIVGTGHGGAQAAIALRQNGFAGSILMLSRDPEPPYERPPLSKEYLAGDKPFERILIRPEAFWAGKDIDLKLGCAVTVVEALPRVLARVAGEPLSEFYQDQHRAHGVDLRLDAKVERYAVQMNAYAGAIQVATGDPVVSTCLLIAGAERLSRVVTLPRAENPRPPVVAS